MLIDLERPRPRSMACVPNTPWRRARSSGCAMTCKEHVCIKGDHGTVERILLLKRRRKLCFNKLRKHMKTVTSAPIAG